MDIFHRGGGRGKIFSGGGRETMGSAQRPHGRSQRENGFFGGKVREASFIRSGERKVLTASTHPNHCVWRRRRRVMSGAKREQSFFSPAQTFSVSMRRIEHRFHPYLFTSQRHTCKVHVLLFFVSPGTRKAVEQFSSKTNLTHHKAEEKRRRKRRRGHPSGNICTLPFELVRQAPRSMG